MISSNSHAKLNLVLDLLCKRPDNYHEVEFIMQELELHDKMTFKKADEIILTANNPEIYCDDRNLIVRAAKLLKEKTNYSGGAEIYLEKDIPMSGGLGGFSVNVGTTVRELNNLWKTNLPEEELLKIAASIGMDCAFPVIGRTCLATGRGEVMKRINSPLVLDLLIVTPQVIIPEKKTAWIFANFDVNRIKNHPSCNRMINAINKKDKELIVSEIGNVFEQGLSIPEYVPVFALISKLKKEKGVLTCAMAGAGPTVFAVTENNKVARELEKKYSKEYKKVFVTKTI